MTHDETNRNAAPALTRYYHFMRETYLWVPAVAMSYCIAIYILARLGAFDPLPLSARNLIAWSIPFALLLGLVPAFLPPRSIRRIHR